MIVENVSPTPFALLRRAKHFQYRDSDQALKDWSEYEDPVQALTEECRRVLKAISAANQSHGASSVKQSTSVPDASWSRFEDLGFASTLEEDSSEENSIINVPKIRPSLRSTPASGANDLGRPTTPSWADFLSSGFQVDDRLSPNHLLPPDKILPPIDTSIRQRSSQSHKPRLESDHDLEPGELASITKFDLDDAFWWVWMSSLAPEETPERKSAFGRCAVVETDIKSGRWLVFEEIVRGAAPEPEEGAYIAEKKGFFSWTRRGKGIGRRKSTAGKHSLEQRSDSNGLKPSGTISFSKTSIGPDQQAKIQAAAQQLQQKQQKAEQSPPERRGRKETVDWLNEKTQSVLTLQSTILSEASPAVKWAKQYDREALREAYLNDPNAGRGKGSSTPATTNGHNTDAEDSRPKLPPKESTTDTPAPKTPTLEQKEPEAPPKDTNHLAPPAPASGRESPMPPPKDGRSFELARESMVSPEPTSPEARKHKKLHKDMVKAAGGNGLKKLFSRAHKNRNSKLPENAAQQVNAMIAEETARSQSPLPPPKAEEPKPAPEVEEKPIPAAPATPVTASAPAPAPAPVSLAPQEAQAPEPAPATPVHEVSPVTTNETVPKDEFHRFDQGPLRDMPAFVPQDDVSDGDTDEAVPPPIARHPPPSRSPIPASSSPATAASPVSPKPQPQQEKKQIASPAPAVSRTTTEAQDRWAQIRKNAAERAAQRQQNAATAGAATLRPPAFSRVTDTTDSSDGSIEESMCPLLTYEKLFFLNRIEQRLT